MASAGNRPLIVLYDATCPLCRRLADYGRVRAGDTLEFVSWQEFVTLPAAEAILSETERRGDPDQLRVVDGERVLAEKHAWEAILAVYPPFESLSWIATRIGILGAVSSATYYGGHWARKVCGGCP